MEVLQIISYAITIATGGFALLVTLSKPFRNWLFRSKACRERQEETDRCLLRDRITSVYFKHRAECEIKEYEFENVSRLYKQYKTLGGNSFVDKIWHEMEEWTILP